MRIHDAPALVAGASGAHPQRGLRVAVTGGAGFIGANLCRWLGRLPGVGSLVVLDDLSTGRVEALPPAVEFVPGSVLDAQAVRAALRNADAVVHLAARSSVADCARDPLGSFRVNALGTAIVFEQACRAGVRLAVLTSSAAVYGERVAALGEDAVPQPISAYGAGKLAAEAYVAGTSARAVPALVLRLFNVYGPGQLADDRDGAVVPAFVARALRGQPVTLNGDGSQTRDFVYVEDVCRVIATALERGISHPGPVNLGTGVATSLRALVRRLEDVIGRPVSCEYRPARPGDIRDSRADIALLRRLLPDFVATALPVGLAATVSAHEPGAPATRRPVPGSAARR